MDDVAVTLHDGRTMSGRAFLALYRHDKNPWRHAASAGSRLGFNIRFGGPKAEEWIIPLHVWARVHSARTSVAPAPARQLTRTQARLAELRERGSLR